MRDLFLANAGSSRPLLTGEGVRGDGVILKHGRRRQAGLSRGESIWGYRSRG